jgi:hypothetical protein
MRVPPFLARSACHAARYFAASAKLDISARNASVAAWSTPSV